MAEADVDFVAATVALVVTEAVALELEALLALVLRVVAAAVELDFGVLEAEEAALELAFWLEIEAALEEETALAELETAEEATLGVEAALEKETALAELETAEEATLGVEAALDALNPTATLLSTRTFAAPVEDEPVLDVLETAEVTTLDVG